MIEQKYANNSQESYSYISSLKEGAANKEQGRLNGKVESSTSIDLECLSPLPFPPSSSSSTNKVISSSSNVEESFTDQKNERGRSQSQKLKVKIYNNSVEDKNENSCLSAFAHELAISSASTSAASPQCTEPSQSKNDISESKPNKHVNEEIKEEHSENNQESEVVANNNAEALNSSNEMNNSNADQTQEANSNNFIDSLEFILDKTPIMSIFMSMICLALISGIGVSMMEGKYSHKYLFIIVYIFLLYASIEKILKMMRDLAPRSPSFSLMITKESFYDVVDVISLLLVSVNADLMLSGTVSTLQYSVYYLLGVFCFYCFYASSAPWKTKAVGIGKRLFLVIQVYAIVFKVENELDFPWKAILCSTWILLGGVLIKLCETMKKIINAVSGFSILGMISRSSKAIGIIALWLIIIDVIALMMVMIGFCKKLDLDDDGEFLKSWLVISQYLNAFLLVYCTITGMDLLEFVLIVTEHFYGSDMTIKKPEAIQLVNEIKQTYMLRMSPTYFKVIENYSQSQEESSPLSPTENSCLLKTEVEPREESLCYICCNNEADGVIINCGHGGVCHGCLLDYINRKDECMECRTKVENLLKIDSEIETGKVFMGQNVCKILRSGTTN
jgi:hypothetical protein